MPATTNPSNHLLAYTVKEIAGNRSIYTKIGAAFPHKEGAGFNVELDAFPCDGRLVILPPRPHDSHDEANEPVSA